MTSHADLALIIVAAPIAWIVLSIQNARQPTEPDERHQRRIRKRQAAQQKTHSDD